MASYRLSGPRSEDCGAPEPIPAGTGGAHLGQVAHHPTSMSVDCGRKPEDGSGFESVSDALTKGK